jgi:hypothetical protein
MDITGDTSSNDGTPHEINDDGVGSLVGDIGRLDKDPDAQSSFEMLDKRKVQSNSPPSRQPWYPAIHDALAFIE